MAIEMYKVPTILEEARKYIEEGNSVAIFVNFTQTLKTIADELKTTCVIHGQQTLEERNKAINDFNSNKSDIIVCNMASGGVGISLHDTTGVKSRVSLLLPGYSAQQLIQALGRVHRANGKTPVRQRILYCANTIETEMCKSLVEKIKNIALLNDKDLDSYYIENLIDIDDIGVTKDANLSEFDKLFLKISVLNVKKQRLEEDLKEVNNEIKEFEIILNTLLTSELNHYLY
jgi:SNF2 family DNA or RNA helicase